MRTRTRLSILVLAALPAACSSGDDTGTTGTTTSTGTTSVGGGGSGGGGLAGGSAPSCNQHLGEGGGSCTPASYPPGTDEIVVNTVTADVVDLDGNPAASILADVCGLNICYSGNAGADGHISVNADGDSLTEGLMLYGDGIDWVRLVALLPAPPNVAFGTISAARLPAPADGVVLALGQALTSGEVTLELDAAAFLEFDILTYCEPGEQRFRAVTLPLDGSATWPGVDPALQLEMAFGMAPISTMICPPAKMTVPNSAGWTANAAVEFLLQGTSVFQEWAVLGEWTKISDGVVSADGLTVSTLDGQGIPEIGTIGVRLTPAG
jgi:hypothetical protein